MDIIEPDLLLFLAATTAGITLLLAVLVIAVRIRKVRERLLELDALQHSVQTVETNLAELVQIVGRLSGGRPELPSFGLHLRQIKRDQFGLSEKLTTISSAIDALRELLQLREQTKREQEEEIREVADASKALQEWKSRVTAVYTEAGHLFESEPVRELIERVGAQPPSLVGEPGDGSERRIAARSQKRVRPRRKR
jgi:hypothetical protein